MTDVPSNMPAPVAVHVERYKNLSDTWIPWSNGMAFFGENGAGKTNLLEALAILLGTVETISLCRDRLPKRLSEGALSMICEVSWEEMPLPPSLVLPLDVGRFDLSLQRTFPVLARVAQDTAWWEQHSVSEGDSVAEGLANSGQPVGESTLNLIGELEYGMYPSYIRYTLKSFERDFDASDGFGTTVRRVFSRTLVVPVTAEESSSVEEAWPELEARRFDAPLPGCVGFIELLDLPDVMATPVVLQWLPRARTSEEANRHLVDAFNSALAEANALAEGLGELPIGTSEFDPDTTWWVHLVARGVLSSELSLTLPHMSLEIVGDGDPDIDLIDGRRSRSIARTGDFDVLEYFSSGERRWIDEAFATTGRALLMTASRARWQAPMLAHLQDSDLLQALESVTAVVQQAHDQDGYWSGESMDTVLQVLDGPLVAAARASLGEADNALSRGLVEAQFAGLDSLRPRRIVRVFDEPEAHLHPAAQRQIAASLERLRLRGEDVIIASHSPQFLDLAGWQLLHIQNAPSGTRVSALSADDTDARHTLAREMGWTRGELLCLVSYVLIVEGEHDRVVLNEVFGRELRDAGIAVLRMHGTSHILATADMDFVLRHMDVPMGVLVDYAILDNVKSNRPNDDLSDEERSLRMLRQACRRAGRQIDLHALRRPDIVAYIPDIVVQQLFNDSFPGWNHVLKHFKSLRARPSFKGWVARNYGVDLVRTDDVVRAANAMGQLPQRPDSDLTAAVNAVLTKAHQGRWSVPDPEGNSL